MFNNIGEKIKGAAVVLVLFGNIFSFCGAMYYWVNGMLLVGIVILILGCILSWFGAFLVYGFGELIDQTNNISKSVQRMQMLAVYNDSNDSSEIAQKTINNIKDEIVKAYENSENNSEDFELDESANIPNADECPYCFHKINVDDEECSYCGHKLK